MRKWMIDRAAVSRAQTVHGLGNFIARPGGMSILTVHPDAPVFSHEILGGPELSVTS